MTALKLKAAHRPVAAYYEALGQFEKLGVKHEGAVRSAFQTLLEHCARQAGRALVPEYRLTRKGGRPIEPDGAIVDSLSQVLRYGLWEAKDTDDDLEKEIKAKFKAGYPRDNILFQEPRRAILYQNGEKLVDADLTKPDQLGPRPRSLFRLAARRPSISGRRRSRNSRAGCKSWARTWPG